MTDRIGKVYDVFLSADEVAKIHCLFCGQPVDDESLRSKTFCEHVVFLGMGDWFTYSSERYEDEEPLDFCEDNVPGDLSVNAITQEPASFDIVRFIISGPGRYSDAAYYYGFAPTKAN